MAQGKTNRGSGGRIATLALIACLTWGGGAVLATPEEEAVRKVDVSWGEAFRTCNMPMMEQILHEDLIFIVQNGTLHHRADQLASVRRCDMKRMDVTPARIQVIGTVALVHGTLDYRLDGPRSGDGRLQYSRAYVKGPGGTWRMVQHQSTAVPIKPAQ